ncbi:peptide chain release factor N(5)-glutamine methyltransferase [Candidatus Gracilibacteria bacterium]|nr:peptide chain release factor N(5)-glutamine methyltransferase [Candidatus Gracilibacteria bacterium]
MNIRKIITWAETQFQNLEKPRLEAEVLLAEVLQCNRVFLKTHPEKDIPFWKELLYKKFVQKRKDHIPLAYIIGYKDWGEMRIFVNEHVLIPRDETEILCHTIIDQERSFIPHRIFDIGTGSGNIALFLAKNIPDSFVIGVDISHKALKMATHNAIKNNISNVRFLHGNLVAGLAEKKFDIIVANLPYIPTNMKLAPEVLNEPPGALFAGSDGLDVLRMFAGQIANQKFEFRELWLEFLPSQKEEVTHIFQQYTTKFFQDAGRNVFFAQITVKGS